MSLKKGQPKQTVKMPDKDLAREKSLFNMRVRSWLRMNAGGVLNTCKSNEPCRTDPFGVKTGAGEWRTGE